MFFEVILKDFKKALTMLQKILVNNIHGNALGKTKKTEKGNFFRMKFDMIFVLKMSFECSSRSFLY